MSYFERVLYGVLELRDMLPLFHETNKGIYYHLQVGLWILPSIPQVLQHTSEELDALLPPSSIQYHKLFSSGLAGAYRAYIEQHVQPLINAPPEYLTKFFGQTIRNMIYHSGLLLPDVDMDGLKAFADV